MKDDRYYRKKYNIPKDFLLIGDSGGYEQATHQGTAVSQGLRLDALDIVNWQKENVDIGFTLDVPPVKPDQKQNLQFTDDIKFFETCAEKSKDNAEIAHRNLGNTNMKLYCVLQGHTKQQLDMWSKGKLTFNDFDGAALSHKSTMLTWLSVQAMYAKEHGVKRIHVLTGTGYNSTPLIAYLKKHFKQVTFDSSSYGQGARNRSYNLPYHYKIYFGDSYNGKIKELPCNCPICHNVSVEDFLVKTSVAGALLSLHNLYKYLEHVNFLNGIVDDDQLFTNYIEKHTNQRTQKAFKFIKSCEEVGFDDTYEKYGLDFHNKHYVQVNAREDWF